MASMTRCGTCVPPGPSRKTAGCPLTVCASEGNCERTQVRSSEVEEACSAIGIGGDILNGAARRLRASVNYLVPGYPPPDLLESMDYGVTIAKILKAQELALRIRRRPT